MTEVVFILPSVSSDLEFLSVNHTSIYENSAWKILKNTKFLGKISNTRLLNCADNECWQYYSGIILLQ